MYSYKHRRRARKPTSGNGLKITYQRALLHVSKSSIILDFYTDKFHNCKRKGYLPAMHTNLYLKEIKN